MLIRFLAYTILCLVSLSCSDEIDSRGELDTYIQDEMEEQEIAGLSVLLFDDRAVVHENSFGYADPDQDTLITSKHLFLLASVSKMVTATALLQLFEEGKFDLDDPINDYLDFEINSPHDTTSISFRMLLTHTSAIADSDVMDNFYFYSGDSPLTLDFIMRNYFTPNGEFYDAAENFYDFQPSTQYEYSNMGAALIGYLVERISGQDFRKYCEKRIFRPLLMNHTYWSLNEILEEKLPLAYPLEPTDQGFSTIGHYTFADYPNGGLRSNPRDLFAFVSTLVNDGSYFGIGILDSTTVAEMHTIQNPRLNEELGLHVYIMNENHQLWGHDGGEQGASTIVGYNKDTKKGVILLANSEADLDAILEACYELALKI